MKGERLSSSEGDVTQDFVLVNGGPSFMVPNAKAFLSNLKLLEKTTDKMEGLKVATSAVMRGVEKAFEAVGSTSAKIRGMGGQPETHILGEAFFSQVPILFGPYMAKLSLAPVSPESKALTGKPFAAGDNPFAIRDAVIEFFHTHGGEWELRAQLCIT